MFLMIVLRTEVRSTELLTLGRDRMTLTKRRAFGTIVVLGALWLSIGGVLADNKTGSRPKPAQPAPSAAKSPAAAKPDAELQKVVVQGKCTNEEAQPLANVRVLVM